VKHDEKHVRLLRPEPTDGVKPWVSRLGKSFETVKRRQVSVGLRECFFSHRLLDAVAATCCEAWNALTPERLRTSGGTQGIGAKSCAADLKVAGAPNLPLRSSWSSWVRP
jgi:hypothetical protein